MVEQISEQKWSWAGQTDDRRTKRQLELGSRQGQRGVGRPSVQWIDNIRETAGKVADGSEYQARMEEKKDTHVQQLIENG